MTTREQPWHGVMVATALPLRDDLIRWTKTATPSTAAGWSSNGCHGVVPNGSLGEYQTLTAEERARVVERRDRGGRRRTRHAGRRGVRRRRGPALGRAGRARPGAGRDAPPAQRLPGRRRAPCSAHYREVAKAGLPIVAYNNPHDTKVDLAPDLLAELHERGPDRGRQGVLRRRPPGLRDPRAGARTSTCSPASDDVLLELAHRRAPGWIAGYPNALPRRVRGAVPARRSPATSPRALPLYRSAAPAAALGREDRVRAGHQVVDGPRRPVRRAVPPAARAAVRRAGGRGPGGDRERRWPNRVDDEGAMRSNESSTRSTRTPRACRPGSSPAASASIPGATMAERRRVLHGPHGRHPQVADVRAARPRGDERRDPAAADPPGRRLRRALHRGVRLPADVRARHDRASRRSWSRPGWSRSPSPSPRSGWTPRPGWSSPRSRVEDGAAAAVTITNVPSFAVGLDRTVDGARLRRVDLRHGLRRQLLRDPADRDGRPAVRPARKDAHPGGGPGDHGGDQRSGRAGAPGRPGDRGLSPRPVRRSRLRRPALAARDGHPSRLVRPLALRHGDQRPHGPAARARRARRSARTSSTSRSSAPGSPGGWWRRPRWRGAGRWCPPSRAGPG